uniref:Uncharacterized protein n=1 Tax=Arundo donax TaxID=35708 RepID=A0A0A8YHQ3_ARUDO
MKASFRSTNFDKKIINLASSRGGWDGGRWVPAATSFPRAQSRVQ